MTLLNYIKFPIIVLISFILVGCGDERLPDSKNNEKIVRIGTADNNGRLSGLLGLAKQLGYLEEELQKLITNIPFLVLQEQVQPSMKA